MIWPIHRTDYDGNTLTAIRKRNSSTGQLTAVQSRQAITNNNKFVCFFLFNRSSLHDKYTNLLASFHFDAKMLIYIYMYGEKKKIQDAHY